MSDNKQIILVYYKKGLALLLTFMIIISNVITSNASYFGDSDKAEFILGNIPGITFDIIKNNFGLSDDIKEFIKRSDGKILYFNEELFIDKDIVVYGDQYCINGKVNDWKAKGNGYYNNGEFRYRGYSINGNYYTNKDFPNDCNSEKSLEDKKWIYRWWVEKRESLSDFNGDALQNTPIGNLMKKQINNLIPFEIRSSTQPKSPNQVYEHLNVLSFSSTLFNGEGRMFHRGETKDWYQTFSTEPIQAKQPTPYKLEVEILDKSQVVVKGKETVLLRVMFTGTLVDGSTYKDDTLRVLYFNREDVKSVSIQLNRPGYPILQIPQKDILMSKNAQGDMTYSGMTEIQVKTTDLYEGLPMIGSSYLTYHNQSVSELATDTDDLYVAKPAEVPMIKEKPIECLYSIDSIKLKPQQPLTTDLMTYKDASIGPISRYVFEVAGEKISDTGMPSGDKIKQLMLAHIQSRALELETNGHIEIQTEQVVYDVLGNASVKEVVFSVINDPSVSVIQLGVNLPEKVFDIMPYPATFNAVGGRILKKSVTIDGVSVDFDDFFSGTFRFGASDLNRPVLVKVTATSEDGIDSYCEKWVTVYTTKPKAQLHFEGQTKVNRKIRVMNDSETTHLNDSYLLSHYSNQYTYRLEGDSTATTIRKISELERHMLHKKPGLYAVELIASNALGRVSEPYRLQYWVQEDLKPNTVFNIWNNVLIRGEKLDYVLDVASLDGDRIGRHEVTIQYDGDSDGTYETAIAQLQSNQLATYPWTFKELGAYKIISYAEETISPEETLTDCLENSDLVTTRVEREFFVDNLRPVTGLDLDLPANMTSVDVLILGSEQLPRPVNTELRENKVKYANELRLSGLDAIVNYWDTHTYRYENTATKQVATGQTPPDTTYAYNENGYTGSLMLTQTVNNPKTTNEGGYTTERECSTEPKYCQVWKCADFPPSAYEYAVRCGPFWGYWATEICGTTTVCREVSVWRDRYVTQNQYTGYYSGQVVKQVKQDYVNSFRQNADRYVIVIADANGVSKADYNRVIQQTTCKTVFIGTDMQKKTLFPNAHHFIEVKEKNIPEAMKAALNWIDCQYEATSTYLMEKGTPFKMTEFLFDTEADKLLDYGYQYVQEQPFDNDEGRESFARSIFSDRREAFSSFKATTFSKPGKYTIYKMLEDQTGQAAFDKASNLASVSVLVHRRPIANFKMTWDYNTSYNAYETAFEDLSYDLDHEFSDTMKGIRQRDASYRQLDGDQQWHFGIPSRLSPGTYEMRYTVKDMEGLWSMPKTQVFTLAKEPGIQLKAKLRPAHLDQSLTKLPIGSAVQWYEVWTRAPYPHVLEATIWSAGKRIEGIPVKRIQATAGGVSEIVGNDYSWTPFDLLIPKGIGLKGQQVTARIEAIKLADESVRQMIEVPVTLVDNLAPTVEVVRVTPEPLYAGDVARIQLLPKDPEGERMRLAVKGSVFKMSNGKKIKIRDLNAFSQIDVPSHKSISIEPFGLLEAGQYELEFEVVDTGGLVGRTTYEFEVLDWGLISATLSGAWQHWRGQRDRLGVDRTAQTNRFLSYEKIQIRIETKGQPDRVEVRFSPELESMTFTDAAGKVYSYEKQIGTVVRFPLVGMKDLKHPNNYQLSYILPLAPSTLDEKGQRLREGYWMEVFIYKQGRVQRHIIGDPKSVAGIEITGNIFDHLYLQPSK